MTANTLEQPSTQSGDADDIFAAVAQWAEQSARPLYEHQEEALLHLVTGNNVVLATPTGSGKTMVAIAALYAGLATGRRAWYTAPIKALVSEKFFEMVGIFGADNVGMLTGDSAVNPDAPIICCTAEVLAVTALRSGRDADVGVAVLDEFHYYGDRQRGWAWQVPLLELPQAQFLLMSGTLGDTTDIAADLSERTGRHTEIIGGVERPVPLDFDYQLLDVPEATRRLVDANKAPVYLVHFTQRSAVEQAQGLVGLGLTDRTERDAIAEVIADFRFAKGFGRTLSRLVRAGIGVHHAGMLPRYRRLVERLAQSGLLKVICGTDTLGVGINVPIRTVLFTALAKYDGHKSRVLSAREFHQIAGRAGRAGFDTAGYVIALAPEHAVANAKAQAKADAKVAKTGKKAKTTKTGAGKSKPRDGEIAWTQQTFDRLVEAEPEPLGPHLRMSHTVVLAMLARPTDAVAGIRNLVESSHEPRRKQLQLLLRAIGIGRSLITAGIVERMDELDENGRRFVITGDLQLDFALDQPLSPLALATIEILDTADENYPLDVVSIMEATLQGPMPVLIAQRRRARDEAMWQMKADGLEYEERMNRLDEIDYPKPLADLIEHAYEKYRAGNPWVTEFAVEPKSVIRELFERSMTFSEYIAEYQLGRSEGVVLRYLAQGYRALRRTVPVAARTEELTDIISWLGEMVRGIDSSLLAEWEALAHPDDDETGGEVRPAAVSTGISGNLRGFTVMVRNSLFRRVELAAHRRFETLGELDGDNGFKAEDWRDAIEQYFEEYDDLGIGQTARSAELISIDRGSETWRIRQTFDDPAADRDWGITVEIDLAASDEIGEPELKIIEVGPFS